LGGLDLEDEACVWGGGWWGGCRLDTSMTTRRKVTATHIHTGDRSTHRKRERNGAGLCVYVRTLCMRLGGQALQPKQLLPALHAHLI
jgi:hypothetical protein